jgi:hypothetical protein
LKLAPVLIAFAFAGVAHADEALITARLPGGPDAPAPGLGASVEAGWGGARAQAIGAVSAEALLAGQLTLRAGVEYELGQTRPVAGASFAILDPYRHVVGLLAGIAYKPEGLTEAEGELEATVALARRVGAGLASASLVYGQDPDLKHHDGEAALSLVEPISARTALGGVARARSGLGSTTELGASWDALAGALARARVGAYTLTAIGGLDAIALTGGTRLGVLATFAVGAWW